MKEIKNENDGKKSLHGIRQNGIRRNGKTPITQCLLPATRQRWETENSAIFDQYLAKRYKIGT